MKNYTNHAAINEQWPGIGWAPQNSRTDVPRAMTQMIVAATGKDWGTLKEQGRKDAQAGIKAKLSKEVAGRMTPA